MNKEEPNKTEYGIGQYCEKCGYELKDYDDYCLEHDLCERCGGKVYQRCSSDEYDFICQTCNADLSEDNY